MILFFIAAYFVVMVKLNFCASNWILDLLYQARGYQNRSRTVSPPSIYRTEKRTLRTLLAGIPLSKPCACAEACLFAQSVAASFNTLYCSLWYCVYAAAFFRSTKRNTCRYDDIPAGL